MPRRFAMNLTSITVFLGLMYYPAVLLAQQPTCATPPPNMIAWWPADGNYNDIVGNNNGVPLGSVPFATGEVGQAFSFSGSSSVQVPSSSALLLGSGEMTLDSWISTTTVPTGNLVGPIVGKLSPSYPYQGYGLQVEGDGTGRVRFVAADCTTPSCGWGTTEVPVISNSAVTDGNFHLVVGVRRNPGTYEIWVDGVLENSVSQAMVNTDSSNGLYMGQLDGVSGYWYTGLTDEVEIFNRALSASEIQAIFNAGSAGKCKGATLTPTKLAFGTVLVGTASPLKTATLTNVGPTTLDINSIETAGEFLQSNTCPASLAPGANCVIDVTFAPTMKGSENSQLLVSDSAPNSPQVATLSGAGTYVELTPAKLNFGKQSVGTVSLPQTVTLTNTSAGRLSITGISITGTNAIDFSETNTCGTSVLPGKACTITGTFTPTAKGNRSAQLSITDNGGASPQKVSLMGMGT